MTALKRPFADAGDLALWMWIAVVLTPIGWLYGAVAIAFSYEGGQPVVSQVVTGLFLFAAAPVSAVTVAIHWARAGHRSGKIAAMVCVPLLLATLAVLTGWIWWVGLSVTAVAAALVCAGALSRRIAVGVSMLLLLAVFVLPAMLLGGWWIKLAVIGVIAVLAFAWARSRSKPPPGPDDTQQLGEGPPLKDRLSSSGTGAASQLR
jgi:hypothetical protein